MHRVIAGCNLWALVLLAAAGVLGATAAPYHVSFALFAVCFAMLAQCAIFAIVMGASKLLKEHVERFDLSGDLIGRTNRLMMPLFRWATTGSLTAMSLGLVGGLTASGDVSPAWHWLLGMVTMLVLGLAVRAEVPRLRAMHAVLVDMEAALPEPDPAVAADAAVATGGADAGAPDLRSRALVYVGGTVGTMVLGYRYISGLSVPSSLLLLSVGFSLLCLVTAAVLHLGRMAPR